MYFEHGDPAKIARKIRKTVNNARMELKEKKMCSCTVTVAE